MHTGLSSGRRPRGTLNLFLYSVVIFALFALFSFWRVRRLPSRSDTPPSIATTVTPRPQGQLAPTPAPVEMRSNPYSMFFEPCDCADPAVAYSPDHAQDCGRQGERNALRLKLPPGLLTNASYLSVDEQFALMEELNRFEFQGYIGKECLEIGMNFSLYVAKSTADTMPPLLKALGRRLHRDGFMLQEPNYVLVNRYTAGHGIHPHVDDTYYTDSVASVTLGTGAALNFFFDEYGPYFKAPERLALRHERQAQFARKDMLSCAAAYFTPGAVFGMSGEARWGWKHEMKLRDADAVPYRALRFLPGARQRNEQQPPSYRSTVGRGLRFAVTFRRVRDDVMQARWKGQPVFSNSYA